MVVDGGVSGHRNGMNCVEELKIIEIDRGKRCMTSHRTPSHHTTATTPHSTTSHPGPTPHPTKIFITNTFLSILVLSISCCLHRAAPLRICVATSGMSAYDSWASLKQSAILLKGWWRGGGRGDEEEGGRGGEKGW